MKKNRGSASGLAAHLHVAPAHSVVPAGAERLHCRLFSGESGSVTLHAIRLRIAIANLAVSKDSSHEALTKPHNGLRDAGNLRYVNAGANNHAPTLARWRPVTYVGRSAGSSFQNS